MRHLCHRSGESRSLFGDLVILAFLAAQALDGVLTYVGVARFGPAIEGNPLISAMIGAFGEAAALAAAKLFAASLGIALHVGRVHRLVALLTAVYFAVAIAPWTALLLLT